MWYYIVGGVILLIIVIVVIIVLATRPDKSPEHVPYVPTSVDVSGPVPLGPEFMRRPVTCRSIAKDYGIVPGRSWGRLANVPGESPAVASWKQKVREMWRRGSCDQNKENDTVVLG